MVIPRRLAYVGHDVWVGSLTACDECGAEFDNIIHVWRGRDRDEGALCKAHGKSGLTLYYRENDPLAAMDRPVEEVVAYMRRPGRLLIHCRGGQCRSATLGVLARVARGADIRTAIADVWLSVFDAYGVLPWLLDSPIADVCRWAGVACPWEG